MGENWQLHIVWNCLEKRSVELRFFQQELWNLQKVENETAKTEKITGELAHSLKMILRTLPKWIWKWRISKSWPQHLYRRDHPKPHPVALKRVNSQTRLYCRQNGSIKLFKRPVTALLRPGVVVNIPPEIRICCPNAQKCIMWLWVQRDLAFSYLPSELV